MPDEKHKTFRTSGGNYRKKHRTRSFEACNKGSEMNPPMPAAVFLKNLVPQDKRTKS